MTVRKGLMIVLISLTVLSISILFTHSITAISDSNSFNINFDTFPDGTSVANGSIITNQYASFGATFSSTSGGALILSTSESQSSPNILIGNPNSFQPITIDIVDPNSGNPSTADSVDVTLISVGDATVTVKAFASNLTTVLESISVTNPGTGVGLNNKNQISLVGPEIARVTFEITNYYQNDGFGIDDLNIKFPNITPTPTPTLSPWIKYIDFDHYPDGSPIDGTASNGTAFPGTLITNQYTTLGATFSTYGGPIAGTAFNQEASSPPNFLVGNPDSYQPITINIVDPNSGNPSTADSLDVTLISVGDATVTVKAFASDLTTVLESISVTNPGTGVGLNNKNPISLIGPGIARVTFEITNYYQYDGFGIDDLYIKFPNIIPPVTPTATPTPTPTPVVYIQYTLTVNNDGHGTTAPAGASTVNHGAGTPIIAIPNPGYHFINWIQTGGSGTATFGDSTAANTTVTVVDGDVTIGANFRLPITSISGGLDHGLALKNDGTVWAWGWNGYGQLGNGTNMDSNIPVQVNGLSGVIAIAGGDYHSLALKRDGTVWTWGSNECGQLGNGTNTNSNTPVQVNGLSGVITIAGGDNHGLALKNDGTVWAWGLNNYGQLGNGTTTWSKIPVQVSGLNGVVAIAGGGCHSLAIKNDGKVWAWGYNGDGRLGNGTYTNSKIPVQVSGLSGVIAIGGGIHSLALKNDGTVWAWGANSYGQLGNGTNTNSNIPVQVSGLSGVITIAGGEYHSLALMNDGTVWAWGYNIYGQLGNGINTSSNIPVQASGLSGVVAVAGGQYYSLALKNDSTVWAWGANSYGQLGNGANTGSNIPAQVSIGLTPPVIPYLYNLTVTNNIGGRIIPSGTIVVINNTSTTITATPNTGYHFVNWTQTGGFGTATFGDAGSASTTVTVTGGNALIQANFASE